MAGQPPFDGNFERRYGGVDERNRDFGRGDYHMRMERPRAPNDSARERPADWERGPPALLRRPGHDSPSLSGGPVARIDERSMPPGGVGSSAPRSLFGDEHDPYRRDFGGGGAYDIRESRERSDSRFGNREMPMSVLREHRDLRDMGPPRDVRDLGPPPRDLRELGPLTRDGHDLGPGPPPHDAREFIPRRDSRDLGPPPLRDSRDLGPMRDSRDMGLPPRELLSSREEVDRFNATSRMRSGPGPGLDMSALGNLSGVSATLASLSSTLPSLGVMEPIVRGQCLLLPPVGGPSDGSCRQRPENCKTVFVGHLPQNTTRQSLYDIFEYCGKVASVRLNQRSHFAHIEFESEDSVNKAMELNNYSIKVDLSGDLNSMGKIIVDYAVPRADSVPEIDPERAVEIEMRRRAREERHKRDRAESPPASFTDSAASEMKENFRKEMKFEESCRTLTYWLEKGLCNRHNTEKFFSLIQTAEGCLKRVLREKRDIELEVRRFIAEIQLKQDGMKRQALSFCKIFALFEKQDKKLYDLFTRPQRKMLQQWTVDAKKLMKEKWVNLLAIAGEQGMISMEEEEDQDKKSRRDSKEPDSKKSKTESGDRKSESDKQVKALKDEMSKLKAQYREKLENRDKEIAKLKEMVGKGRSTKRDRAGKGSSQGDEVPPDDDDLLIKPTPKKQPTNKDTSTNQVISDKESDDRHPKSSSQVSDESVVNDASVPAPAATIKKENEEPPDEETKMAVTPAVDIKREIESVQPDVKAALVGVMAAYLSVHPYGASFSDITHYLRGLKCFVSASVIWSALRESPLAFTSRPDDRDEACDDDVVWSFHGFKTVAGLG